MAGKRSAAMPIDPNVEGRGCFDPRRLLVSHCRRNRWQASRCRESHPVRRRYVRLRLRERILLVALAALACVPLASWLRWLYRPGHYHDLADAMKTNALRYRRPRRRPRRRRRQRRRVSGPEHRAVFDRSPRGRRSRCAQSMPFRSHLVGKLPVDSPDFHRWRGRSRGGAGFYDCKRPGAMGRAGLDSRGIFGKIKRTGVGEGGLG
jgi:hypothetical protein